jgi:hypothetical protein
MVLVASETRDRGWSHSREEGGVMLWSILKSGTDLKDRDCDDAYTVLKQHGTAYDAIRQKSPGMIQPTMHCPFAS